MSTLADPRHRASDPQVKSESKFGETPRKRHWWQRTQETEPAPRVCSTFPNPDADTRILPQVPHRPAATTLPPLHHDPSTNPDQVALNMIRVCAQAMAEHWSSTRLQDALLAHSGELHRRAMREQEGGATIARRVANGHRTAQETAEAIEAAVRVEQVTGVKVPLDPAAMGKGMARAAANAHDLSERTMVGLPRITDDMPDLRIETVTVAGPASPVHVPGSHPPVPDELADPGELKPLPKRVPQRRPVDVLPYSDKDPYAAVDPTVEGQGLEPGAWVFDEGGSTGPVWFLLAEQEDALRGRGRVAVLKFANGFTREVDAGKQVRVLDVRRAQVLLAEHEQKLAARDAEAQAADGAA